MTHKGLRALRIFVFLSTVLFSVNASAQNAPRYTGDNDYYYGNQRKIAFTAEDKRIIRDYYDASYKRICNRNYTKNKKECSQPARKNSYRIGRNLSGDVKVYLLPQALERQLEIPPRGYE